jgi:hypothetical protein
LLNPGVAKIQRTYDVRQFVSVNSVLVPSESDTKALSCAHNTDVRFDCRTTKFILKEYRYAAKLGSYINKKQKKRHDRRGTILPALFVCTTGTKKVLFSFQYSLCSQSVTRAYWLTPPNKTTPVVFIVSHLQHFSSFHCLFHVWKS